MTWIPYGAINSMISQEERTLYNEVMDVQVGGVWIIPITEGQGESAGVSGTLKQ